MQPWHLPPTISHCPILQVSLGSNIRLCLTVQISQVYVVRCLHYPLSLDSPPSPPMMRHTSTTVSCSRGGWFLLSQRRKMPIAGNSSSDSTPGLSIKSNNYILPYSLQILTLLLLLDDNM
jgi:hypothetical protein